jgi:23S rRNA (adenine2503-C2)-methyltransferase
MGFLRNLSAGEILGQVYALKEIHGFSIPFNVVFMGMGEPLLNLREVQKAFTLLTHPQGLNLGAKRITISTSGLPRQMLAIASWPKHPKLAVSLNASEDVGRTALMPINQKHNITDLLRACHQYSQQTGDPITFEYVMMKGVNDHREDAKRLIRLLGPLKCKINLIPFNANPGLPFQEPEEHTLIQFQELLNRSRIQNTIRYSKGRDVGAACGQLVASGPKDTPLQV